jgi:solute carrier family 13 (sodium-dependent dicarboxylate transporter), member 2/3/5
LPEVAVFPKVIFVNHPKHIGHEDPLETKRDTEKATTYQTRILIGFALMAVVLILPLENLAMMDGLDADRVRLGLGIFVCIAFLWISEALPLAATALMVPLLAVLTGVGGVRDSVAPFANPLIVIFFGGFALATAMAVQGLDRWVALSLVRLGRGRFLPVAALVFCGTAFLSMWMSNTATAAMMIPLALGILSQMEPGEHMRRNRVFLMLGLAYAASIGGLGTVIGSPPNVIAAAKLNLTFAQWMMIGLPVVILGVPLMSAVLWWIWRPDNRLKIEIRVEEFHFHWRRFAMLAIFVTAAGCWVFGKPLGGLLGVEADMDSLVALGLVFLLLFFRVVEWRHINAGTDWGVLLLFGGGLALSGILSSTGASEFLARGLTALTGGWPVFLLAAAVVTFVIFLTELASNTAVAALFVPVFHALAIEQDMLPGQLVLPLALAASCAFMMPVATPPNALVYGTGFVEQRDMMRSGLRMNFVFIIFLALLSMLIFR